MVKNRAWSVIAAFTLLVVQGCGAGTEREAGATRVELGGGLVALVTVRYSVYDDFRQAGKALFPLFDGNPDTSFDDHGSVCGNGSLGLRFNLNRPVYFRGVSVRTTEPIFALTGRVSVSETDDVDAPALMEMDPFVVAGGGKTQTLKVRRPYFGVLAGRSIEVEIDGGCQRGEWVRFSELDLDVTEEATFKPTMDFAEVRQKVVSSSDVRRSGLWAFRGDGAYESPKSEMLLSHLMYFGLSGSDAANALFLNYSPPSAEDGEAASTLGIYYGLEKDRLSATNGKSVAKH